MKYSILKNRPRGFRASGLVIKDGNVLLMKQTYNGDEFYNIPGGAVEEDETIEEACIREVMEEFNIRVSVKRLIYIIDSPSRINFVFDCEYIDGEIELGGPEKDRMNEQDMYEVCWLDISKISSINLKPVETKTAVIKYLENKNQPVFLLNTYQEINNHLLIISPDVYEIPPLGYGGIERIVTLSYLHYVASGYSVDIVSKEGSKLHDFSVEEIENINFKKYRFILCFRYDEALIKKLDKIDPQVYLILENNFSDKLNFLGKLKNIKVLTISKDQQQQYFEKTGYKFEMISNGIDMGVFYDKKSDRTKDIIYIGALGQHKSPLSCLEYAIKNDLGIDFYGPNLFRADEKDYEKVFTEKAEQYKKCQIHGELTNDEEKALILNNYKYFIFLPGVDKNTWVEPFGLAPLEAIACGCVVITQFDKGGHLSFCNETNSINYLDTPHELDRENIAKSVDDFNFEKIFKTYYPK